MNKIICGVDVSKDWLDAHVWPEGAAERFTNDATGIAALWLFCRSHGAAHAVMEASGGYERLGFMLLWAHGMPCCVVNAKSVRRFAEAMGYLEKTDRIDAAVIAHYSAVKKTVPTPPPSAAQQRLAALVGRLCQVVGDATINKQRRSAARDAETCASIEAMLAFLKREQRRLEGEIASMLDDDPLWSRLERAFRSLKGVAGRTVLMAELPEIGLISNKAIAKLAGLAPIANDSGRRAGNRHVRGGRAGPRGILFIVAAIVAKFDPHLKAFAQRLQQAGKPKMLIRIALARKLLVILNAKARDARSEFANAT
ncbi:IS110 family transposase [Mesorhizobium sp. B2-1-8]|uniref:IS110 family transposase n=1 Tax=Mesorhizobium sp. B2-1-8 TaxID=2589967 RepID=UPI00112EE91C|nr:IS110 family transposase [Mesorhizobium sp. B2-1-8]UCI22171.1 IS110 family transposase [Mesorhizobium sp. B2-1-8]